jgi:hypothetical protein
VLQSQQYHLNNPYWKTFDPYVLPLLDAPMDLRRFEEMDTSLNVLPGKGPHVHEDSLGDTTVSTMYQDAE